MLQPGLARTAHGPVCKMGQNVNRTILSTWQGGPRGPCHAPGSVCPDNYPAAQSSIGTTCASSRACISTLGCGGVF
eukprot:9251634-Alexandrium_andersonii.AAC.1